LEQTFSKMAEMLLERGGAAMRLDGLIATLSRVASPGNLETETADNGLEDSESGAALAKASVEPVQIEEYQRAGWVGPCWGGAELWRCL
jgi:hypothetical protein